MYVCMHECVYVCMYFVCILINVLPYLVNNNLKTLQCRPFLRQHFTELNKAHRILILQLRTQITRTFYLGPTLHTEIVTHIQALQLRSALDERH